MMLTTAEKTENAKNTEDVAVKLDSQEINVKIKKSIGVLNWKTLLNVVVQSKELVMIIKDVHVKMVSWVKIARIKQLPV